MSSEHQRLLPRRGFKRMTGISPAAHAQPGPVDPVVGALIIPVIAPVDRAEAPGARFAGLPVRHTQLEAAVAEPRPIGPRTMRSRLVFLCWYGMMDHARCERGDECDGCQDWSLASCLGSAPHNRCPPARSGPETLGARSPKGTGSVKTMDPRNGSISGNAIRWSGRPLP